MAKTGRIEKEDIISDEAINNIKLASKELDKLSCKLKMLAKKYNIPNDEIWEFLKNNNK